MRRVDRFYCIGVEEITFMALVWKYHLSGSPRSYAIGDFPPDMSNPANEGIHLYYDMHRVPIRQGWGSLDD